MRWALSVSVCALMVGGAHADPTLVTIYGPLLEQCYLEADGSEAKIQCIGALSQSCMAEEDGGETTLGISLCLSSEAEVWDVFLNEEYQKSMSWAKSADQEDQEYFPEFANRASALRDAQRAWIAFRDAECSLAYAAWGAGSMRHIAGNDCIMTLTAKRAIEVRNIREFLQ